MGSGSEYIKQRFAEEDIAVTDRQAASFERYYELLVETNKVMNLTAVTEFEEVVSRHFVDSALITK